jgi:hypothetical protein
MATTAYVLGVLTILLIAMISVIVVGIVKIIKLQKQVKEITENLYRDSEHTHRRIDDMQINLQRGISESNSETWLQFERAGKDVTMVEQTLMNRIDQAEQRSTSYIDSRIDKLVDTYFEVMGSKKIIKG